MAWHPFRNLGLKVVALALGTLLWFTVSGQQVERPVPGVPVVYRNKPAARDHGPDELVDIHVRGLDSQLRTLQARDFEARVDLTGARPGSAADSAPHRSGARRRSASRSRRSSPGAVMALLEVSGAANLTVVADVDGTPAPGFVVSEIDGRTGAR